MGRRLPNEAHNPIPPEKPVLNRPTPDARRHEAKGLAGGVEIMGENLRAFELEGELVREQRKVLQPKPIKASTKLPPELQERLVVQPVTRIVLSDKAMESGLFVHGEWEAID